MNGSGRSTVLSIALLAVAAVTGIATASASATGTTAYTCAANVGPGKQFSDGHCLTAASGEGGFKHVEITMETNITGTNANTASGTTAGSPEIFFGTPVAVATQVSCSTASTTGTLKNTTSGAEMILLFSLVTNYTGCEVIKPAGKGCKVKEGKITTKPLSATTKEQGSFLKISPTEGTELAGITFEGCSVSGLNNTFPLTGSYKVPPNGATLPSSPEEVTAQNTLKLAGQKAGLEGDTTLKGPSGAAIAVT